MDSIELVNGCLDVGYKIHYLIIGASDYSMLTPVASSIFQEIFDVP